MGRGFGHPSAVAILTLLEFQLAEKQSIVNQLGLHKSHPTGCLGGTRTSFGLADDEWVQVGGTRGGRRVRSGQ